MAGKSNLYTSATSVISSEENIGYSKLGSLFILYNSIARPTLLLFQYLVTLLYITID